MQNREIQLTSATEERGATLDPVCGMRVDPARAAGSHEYGGTTYYFCSKGPRART